MAKQAFDEGRQVLGAALAYDETVPIGGGDDMAALFAKTISEESVLVRDLFDQG